jgi:hypothetical protein
VISRTAGRLSPGWCWRNQPAVRVAFSQVVRAQESPLISDGSTPSLSSRSAVERSSPDTTTALTWPCSRRAAARRVVTAATSGPRPTSTATGAVGLAATAGAGGSCASNQALSQAVAAVL